MDTIKNEANIVEYLKGLPRLATSLEKLIAGSNLSHQELATLAYITGYLKAAKSHYAEA